MAKQRIIRILATSWCESVITLPVRPSDEGAARTALSSRHRTDLALQVTSGTMLSHPTLS